MKIRKVAGWSLLSTIPLGMLVLAIATGTVPELLLTLGRCVGLFAILWGSFRLIGDDQ